MDIGTADARDDVLAAVREIGSGASSAFKDPEGHVIGVLKPLM